MKYKNLVCDCMMVITLSYQIAKLIEVNIWKDWTMWQVVTRFGSLKIDNGGDTMMGSDDDI